MIYLQQLLFFIHQLLFDDLLFPECSTGESERNLVPLWKWLRFHVKYPEKSEKSACYFSQGNNSTVKTGMSAANFHLENAIPNQASLILTLSEE